MVKYVDGNFGYVKSFLSFVTLPIVPIVAIVIGRIEIWKYKRE